MKKNLIRMMSLLLVICLLFLSGCEKPAEKPAKTPEEFWARTHNWNSEHLKFSNANEYGYYFVVENNLTYLDYATKKSVILCNKVGCKHDDIYCEAYIQGSPFLFFRGEKMYLITSKDDGVHIFQCDLDGTNRESKILLMKDEMEKGNAVGIDWLILNGDEIYYTANYQEPSETSGAKKDPIKAVRRLDLNSWTEQEICRSVENEYKVISVDDNGVLIFERPDFYVVLNIDWNNIKSGEKVLSKEEGSKMPTTLYYWDKRVKNEMIVYQSNVVDTRYVPLAEGNNLYLMGFTENSETIGLKKMDMHIGKSEWLWKEKAGAKSTMIDCWEWDNCVHMIINKNNGNYPLEIYTLDGFRKVEIPFLEDKDTILFSDKHGYIVNKMIEYKPNSSSGDMIDLIYIPIEEASKERPEYTVLYSWGKD